jgi:N6-L-threonylcarbamoyladenine synthase
MLGLGFPGGPAVENAAQHGNPKAVPLPRPLVGSGEPHFSFAGLKTAVLRAVQAGQHSPADIAASFQAAVTDCLANRTRLAIRVMPQATALVVAGGVAANGAVRAALQAEAVAHGLAFIAPPLRLCTDNAAMIAWAAQERIAAGLSPEPDPQARPRWPLDPAAEAVRGAGVKA